MPPSRLLAILIQLQHIDLIRHFLNLENQPFDQWSVNPFSLFSFIEDLETRYQLLEALAAHSQFTADVYLTYMTKTCDVINEKEFVFLLNHPSQDFKKYGKVYQNNLASQLIEKPIHQGIIRNFQTLLHKKMSS